jgi:hypothetical protein
LLLLLFWKFVLLFLLFENVHIRTNCWNFLIFLILSTKHSKSTCVFIHSFQILNVEHECARINDRLIQHARLIAECTPNMQQLWQEQLDRVRRQQQLFRQTVC